MNRIQKNRRRAPWAWMQTGPLTVDPERLLAEACLPAQAAERIPEITYTSIADTAPASVAAETDVLDCTKLRELSAASGEAEPAVEDTKLTLDDFPSLKAAMESFEKRGDPIMIPVDTEPRSKRSAPKRRRAKAKLRKSSSKRNVKRVNLRPAAPRKQSRPKTQAEIDLSHHERHCTICRHPEREAIEEAFCQWRNVKFIAREFNTTGGPAAIYRHARALSLFKQRNLSLRSSLEFVIEQSERIMPTAEGLVKGIRAYTRINDAGEWIDTPTTHIVKVVAMHSPDAGGPANPIPGITLDMRALPSCPDEGRVGLTIESSTYQPLLPDSAPQVENAVTD